MGQTDLVLGMRSGFISRSLHARLQVSVCNLLQFTQFIHYLLPLPPLVFYHFIVLYMCGCIYMSILTASLCILLFAYPVATLCDCNKCNKWRYIVTICTTLVNIQAHTQTDGISTRRLPSHLHQEQFVFAGRPADAHQYYTDSGALGCAHKISTDIQPKLPSPFLQGGKYPKFWPKLRPKLSSDNRIFELRHFIGN